MENFVDFVEDKGEFWYNTTDILSVLGYTKDNKGRIISMQMRGIPFYMTPNKQINGEVWWNDVTLAKFTHKTAMTFKVILLQADGLTLTLTLTLLN